MAQILIIKVRLSINLKTKVSDIVLVVRIKHIFRYETLSHAVSLLQVTAPYDETSVGNHREDNKCKRKNQCHVTTANLRLMLCGILKHFDDVLTVGLVDVRELLLESALVALLTAVVLNVLHVTLLALLADILIVVFECC